MKKFTSKGTFGCIISSKPECSTPLTYMIGNFRFFVSKLLPTSIKWRLIKMCGSWVDFYALIVQGIYPLWNKNDTFSQIYRHVYTRSLQDKKRAFILYSLAQNYATSSGEFAELGTYKGASAYIMKEASLGGKTIHVFDTFTGLPEVSSQDTFWKRGDMAETSYATVAKFLEATCFHIHQGVFPESAKDIPSETKYCFVHIDVDLYQSTLDGCRYFYKKMTPGGTMLFDDYGFLSCKGAKNAIDEFFKDKPEELIYLPSGQCFIIKK